MSKSRNELIAHLRRSELRVSSDLIAHRETVKEHTELVAACTAELEDIRQLIADMHKAHHLEK